MKYVLGTARAETCGTLQVCLFQLDSSIVLCVGMNVIEIPTFPEEVPRDTLFSGSSIN